MWCNITHLMNSFYAPEIAQGLCSLMTQISSPIISSQSCQFIPAPVTSVSSHRHMTVSSVIHLKPLQTSLCLDWHLPGLSLKLVEGIKANVQPSSSIWFTVITNNCFVINSNSTISLIMQRTGVKKTKRVIWVNSNQLLGLKQAFQGSL